MIVPAATVSRLMTAAIVQAPSARSKSAWSATSTQLLPLPGKSMDVSTPTMTVLPKVTALPRVPSRAPPDELSLAVEPEGSLPRSSIDGVSASISVSIPPAAPPSM
jgi:hypothetical protein